MNKSYNQIIEESVLRAENAKFAFQMGIISYKDYQDIIEPIVDLAVEEMENFFKYRR